MNLRKRKGFTLIELIVVMAIIAILVLLAAPKYLNYTKDAHVTAMQQDAKVLSNIALAYNVKNDGDYPVATTAAAGVDTILGTADDVITVTPVTIPAVATDNVVDLTDIQIALGDATIALDDLATFGPSVNESLQGLKNELADYVLVIDGDHEGEVVYVNKILTNSDGAQYISLQAVPALTPIK